MSTYSNNAGAYKVLNSGLQIESLPPLSILRHDDAPPAISEALDTLDEARAKVKEANAAEAAAVKAARENEVPSRQAGFDDAVPLAEKDVRAAKRECLSAARDVVAVVTSHADALRAIGARESLRAHLASLDALEDLAASLAATKVGPRIPALSTENPDRRNAHGAMDPLAILRDRALLVDVETLAEIAGLDLESDLGLVAVRNTRYHFTRWVPARVAKRLTRSGHWHDLNDLTAKEV